MQQNTFQREDTHRRPRFFSSITKTTVYDEMEAIDSDTENFKSFKTFFFFYFLKK